MSQPELATKLRAAGLRLTPQRELVLAAVEKLQHATPDEVFQEVRHQSDSSNLSTVYRTLELLDELGLVSHAHLQDRAPTYHVVSNHQHFHLVCRSCEEIISVDAAKLSALQAELAGLDFTIDVNHLSVFGKCKDCRNHAE